MVPCALFVWERFGLSKVIAPPSHPSIIFLDSFMNVSNYPIDLSPAAADERLGVRAALRPDRQVRHRRHDDIQGGQEERQTDGRKGAPTHNDDGDDNRGGGVEGRAGGGDGGQVHPGAEGAEVPLPRNLLLNEHENLHARALGTIL